MPRAPILDKKNPADPSVFLPSAMIREARRQKGLAEVPVPPVCILDPDGDLVRRLRAADEAVCKNLEAVCRGDRRVGGRWVMGGSWREPAGWSVAELERAQAMRTRDTPPGRVSPVGLALA